MNLSICNLMEAFKKCKTFMQNVSMLSRNTNLSDRDF